MQEREDGRCNRERIDGAGERGLIVQERKRRDCAGERLDRRCRRERIDGAGEKG